VNFAVRCGATLLAGAVAVACGGASSPPPKTAPDAAEPAPALATVTLHWTVRNLDDTFGFLVYRSERAEGPYRRINEWLVRAAEPEMASPEGNRYAYADTTAVPSRQYFYYIDSVTTAGIKNRLSGVIEKVAPQAP
jgi:hypothetical protein